MPGFYLMIGGFGVAMIVFARRYSVARVTAFCTLFLVAMIFSSIVWALCVTDVLYNCTDPGVFDFLMPRDWVHSKQGIEFVSEVRSGRPMSEPDQIRKGWSVLTLWCLWGGMVGSSIILSWGAAKRAGSIPAAEITRSARKLAS